MSFFYQWWQRRFSDPQAVMLAVMLAVGFGVVLLMGNILAPVLASVVIAYVLDSAAKLIERIGGHRILAVAVVFTLFVAFLFFTLFELIPQVSEQLTQLARLLPAMVLRGQELLLQLPGEYPQIFPEKQVDELIRGLRSALGELGQAVLSLSFTSVVGVITLAVYLVLAPVMVFFFLKDKQSILRWLSGYLPNDRDLANQVWQEMHAQLGNYIRGKFWEVLIVGFVTYVGFEIMGLQFALLLASLVGISVIVPYVGFVAVTIPVTLVAYFQFGWTSEFGYLMAVFLIIQALDGNVLVPILFSGVVNLHPVAIIIAILVFGGLWGFWGVFFAIPLATLVRAVLNAWPDAHPHQADKAVDLSTP